MSTAQTYHGSCHCGAVTFSITAALDAVTACNCSICARAGWLLTFVPEAQFTLRSGGDAQSDYQFGKKQIHHQFCKICGIRTFSEGEHNGAKVFAVNVRTLEGVDLTTVSIQNFDGKSL